MRVGVWGYGGNEVEVVEVLGEGWGVKWCGKRVKWEKVLRGEALMWDEVKL